MISADTNLFVYNWDLNDDRRRGIARTAIRFMGSLPETRIGLQVIGELNNVLRKKMKQPVYEAAHNARDILTAFQTFVPSEDNAQEALALSAAGRFSYWDALLLTAARDAGCRHFLSEDMGDGYRFGALTIVNPFGANGPSDSFTAIMAEYRTS